MPTYEYRCRSCDTTFELRRAMAESDTTAACPHGHTDTIRLLSVFASVGATSAAGSPGPGPAPSSGGCGGACACAH